MASFILFYTNHCDFVVTCSSNSGLLLGNINPCETISSANQWQKLHRTRTIPNKAMVLASSFLTVVKYHDQFLRPCAMQWALGSSNLGRCLAFYDVCRQLPDVTGPHIPIHSQMFLLPSLNDFVTGGLLKARLAFLFFREMYHKVNFRTL